MKIHIQSKVDADTHKKLVAVAKSESRTLSSMIAYVLGLFVAERKK